MSDMLIKKIPFGLINGGKTCYINSAFQILVSMEPTIDLLTGKSSTVPSQQKNKRSLYYYLKTTIQSIEGHLKQHPSKKKNFILSTLIQYFYETNASFKTTQEGDVYELLTNFIGSLEEEFSNLFPDLSSEFRNTVTGFQKLNLKCSKCNLKICIDDVFYSIFLSNFNEKHQNTLQAIIDDYYSPKLQNMFCDTCKSETSFEQSYSIERLPKTLIVCLNRNKLVSSKNKIYSVKNDEYISFFSPLNVINSSYKLTAFSAHYGGTNRGHYVCFCKRGEKWYCFNDEKVSEVSEEIVAKQRFHCGVFLQER